MDVHFFLKTINVDTYPVLLRLVMATPMTEAVLIKQVSNCLIDPCLPLFLRRILWWLILCRIDIFWSPSQVKGRYYNMGRGVIQKEMLVSDWSRKCFHLCSLSCHWSLCCGDHLHLRGEMFYLHRHTLEQLKTSETLTVNLTRSAWRTGVTRGVGAPEKCTNRLLHTENETT